jgi:hypothetical protein
MFLALKPPRGINLACDMRLVSSAGCTDASAREVHVAITSKRFGRFNWTVVALQIESDPSIGHITVIATITHDHNAMEGWR